MEQGGRECGWSCPAVKLDLLAASLFAPVWKTAGNRLSICGWTSISLCKAGRQREERLTSSAGLGRGWTIVMNIMCKYERRETKGWFCYGNVVIGTDWVLILCVCSHSRVRVCEQLHACWKQVCILWLSLQLPKIIAHQIKIKRATVYIILITSPQLIVCFTSF